MNKSSAITPPKINQAAGITYFYFLCQKDGLRTCAVPGTQPVSPVDSQAEPFWKNVVEFKFFGFNQSQSKPWKPLTSAICAKIINHQ